MTTYSRFQSWAIVLVTLLAATIAASCAMDPPATEEVEESLVPITNNQPSLYRAGNRYEKSVDDLFYDDILPVFAQRCATCHGCVDSPCQLKLTSYEGIVRGSIDENVFSTRLWKTDQTRMQDHRELAPDGTVDHDRTQESWRNRGFYSVTEGGAQSVMAQLIGSAHDLTPTGGLSREQELWESGPNARSFECVGAEAAESGLIHDDVLASRAMPFGCPGIEDEHYETLSAWLLAGAPGPSKQAEMRMSAPYYPTTINRWESFLNHPGPKAALVSRYIYEHVFFTRLHFDDNPGEFYQLVRSWTAPGLPIEEIVTPHANDGPEVVAGGTAADPGTRIYYRLRKMTEIIVHKDHVTWHLNDDVMARWQELFFDTPWEAPAHVPYGNHNPFEHFEAIPGVVRAQFLIENSLPLIDAMTRGDVCHGSSATYAIRDHFWVWFLDPNSDPSALDPKLGLKDWETLSPTGLDQNTTVRREKRYLNAFESRLRSLHPEGLGVENLWQGEETNRNAMITVLRHDKSASAHHGAFNGDPPTYWVLSYANFERLYYALVVNYNPWGNVNHALETWQFMSFVRADGEDLFISLLPEEHRKTVRDTWTSGFGRAYRNLFFDLVSQGRPSNVQVNPARPAQDLAQQILDYLGPALHNRPDSITSPHLTLESLPETLSTWTEVENGLSTLTARQAPFVRHFPNLTLLRIGGPEGRVYTIVANRWYAAHDHLVLASPARNPDMDTLSINREVVGSYPELFIDLAVSRVPTFLREVHAIQTEWDWARLIDAYAAPSDLHIIPRTADNFWSFLDDMHHRTVVKDPIGAGILDVSEYVWPSLVAPFQPKTDAAQDSNQTASTDLPLPLGIHRLEVCSNQQWKSGPQQWFSFDMNHEGKLAIEVAFNEKDGRIYTHLEGLGVKTKSDKRKGSFQAMTVDVTPGVYRLGIEKRSSGCQSYTIFATLHAHR